MMRPLPAVILMMLVLASCGQPPSREYFQRSDSSGDYSFNIDMPDTLSAYDISFYAAIDRPLFQRDTLSCFPLQVVWRSPSGRFFSETVYYPAGSQRELYRSGVVPSEAGEWNISVTIDPEPEGLRGLGLICEKKSR
ncbi:MAG: hypothetical protein IK031_02990 [Bacteroidales bacterium]|nr:hypothetical protein [Bacteroidales bacterium]